MHSKEEAEAARDAALALFGGGDVRSLNQRSLLAALVELPNAEVSKGVSVIDALVAVGLAGSNSEARRAIEAGSVSVNQQKIESTEATIEDLLAGDVALIAKGKKNLAGLFFK